MIWLALRLHSGLAHWLAAPIHAAQENGVRAQARKPRHPPGWVVGIRSRWPGMLVEVPALWRPVLLFSGLRGALSIALVLSLPAALPQFSLVETIVYGVVLVTLVGQGILLRLVLPMLAAALDPADVGQRP